MQNWIKINLKFIVSFIGFFVAGSIILGCSSKEKKSDTPEDAFAIAAEYDKDDRYEEAIRRYNDVKNKFPYSKLATEAELAVAEVYYKQEAYPEAQISYQAFRDLHPKHPKTDYVVYKIGMSYFNQLPSTIDRDLSLAAPTILNFEDLIKNYSTSQYVKEALDKKELCLKKLAEKELYVAQFYTKKKNYSSALVRFEGLLSKYSGLGFDPAALSGAAVCANKLGLLEKQVIYSKKLRDKFPMSEEAKTFNLHKDSL
jgi:outer membrane protein assembly factor BamD